MHRRLVIGSLVAASFLLAQPAEAITFGTADGNLHPNVAAVVVPSQGGYSPICTGTLISSNVVLTAAHCLYSAAPEDYYVSFDPTFDQKSLRLPGVAYPHPLAYLGGFNDPHDIGVIVLDRSVKIAPAKLPTAGLLSGLKASHELDDQVFTAVGYGQARESKTSGPSSIVDSMDRLYVTQSYLSLQDAWLELSMNSATGDGGGCYGDSGGPHFLGGPTSTLVVSLTVTGDAWCRATDKTYRVDTPAARDFLKGFVKLP